MHESRSHNLDPEHGSESTDRLSKPDLQRRFSSSFFSSSSSSMSSLYHRIGKGSGDEGADLVFEDAVSHPRFDYDRKCVRHIVYGLRL